MTLFRNKYRIESARLAGWNYSNPGYYFITICTHDRGCLFGTIVDNNMCPNEYCDIVNDEWRITGEKNKNIVLDEFMVMPNHIHGIIQIVKCMAGVDGSNVSPRFPGFHHSRCSRYSGYSRRDVARNVSTTDGGVVVVAAAVATTCTGALANTTETENTETVNQIPKNENMSMISPASGSLSVIVRSFKSAITKRVNELHITPGATVLQPRFHDHIIQNNEELYRIRQYIQNNPANWEKDKFNTDGYNAVREDTIEYEKEIWMI